MSIIYDQSGRWVGQVNRHPEIDAGGTSRLTALVVKVGHESESIPTASQYGVNATVTPHPTGQVHYRASRPFRRIPATVLFLIAQQPLGVDCRNWS